VRKDKSYMTTGKLYRLRGMARNKHEQCLRVGYPRRATRSCSGLPQLNGSYLPYHGVKRRGSKAVIYKDGALFLCLGPVIAVYPETQWVQGIELTDTTILIAYKLLAPDGRMVEITARGNKSKFAEVKSRKR